MLCFRCGSHNLEGNDKCAHCGQSLSESRRSPNGFTGEGRRPKRRTNFSEKFGLRPGQLLSGRYRIIDYLGHGPFGAAFKAHDQEIEVDVAVKILHRELFPGEAERAQFRTRMREVRRTTHLNLVRMYDEEFDGERDFVINQFLEGMNLRKIVMQRIEKQEAFAIKELKPIFSHLCQGLDRIHESAIHGNIKPENIIVLPDILKLTDFGWYQALPAKTFVSLQQANKSTASFMAPEWTTSPDRIGQSADVFSISAVLYWMLTGLTPQDSGANPEALPKGVEFFGPLLTRSLSTDPAKRPQNARAFFDEFVLVTTRRPRNAVPETSDVSNATQRDRVEGEPVSKSTEAPTRVITPPPPQPDPNTEETPAKKLAQGSPSPPPKARGAGGKRVSFGLDDPSGGATVDERPREDSNQTDEVRLRLAKTVADVPPKDPESDELPPLGSMTDEIGPLTAPTQSYDLPLPDKTVIDEDDERRPRSYRALVYALFAAGLIGIAFASYFIADYYRAQAEMLRAQARLSLNRVEPPAHPPELPQGASASAAPGAAPSQAADPGGAGTTPAGGVKPEPPPPAQPDGTEKAAPAPNPCPSGMVFVPAGSATIGSAPDDPQRGFGEKDPHVVDIKEFCIDRYEHPNEAGKLPTVSVSWKQAASQCRQQKKRLCTEEEWEYACKGSANQKYAYGNDYKPDACNSKDPDGHERPLAPSGQNPRCKSPFGVFDLSGNASEWTVSIYSPGADSRTTKGGSSLKPPLSTRCSSRLPAGARKPDLGLRCCVDAPTN